MALACDPSAMWPYAMLIKRLAGQTNVTKGYSTDLRERAVAMVEEGESRREVAHVLKLAPSTAVRWLDRWNRTGSVAAKPGTGHSRSPLEVYAQSGCSIWW